jgi:FkbM family methyltransferase
VPESGEVTRLTRKRTIGLIRFLIVLIVLDTAVAIAWKKFDTVQAMGMYVAGRSGCTLAETLKVPDRNRRLMQLADTIYSQAVKLEDEDGLQRWRTPDGEYWFPGPMHLLFAFVLAEMRSDVYDVKRTVRPGDTVLDCGADNGSFTMFALAAGAARVVAIEINPGKQECLRRTFAREISDGRVTIYGKGVWDTDDELKLRGDSVLLNRSHAEIPVRVTTLDKLTAELQLTKVEVIKLDIEGAELPALRGARSMLVRDRPVLSIASEHLPADTAALTKLAQETVPGYRPISNNCGTTDYGIQTLNLKLAVQ